MINNAQHGFHNKHSCLTNLLDFYNNVFNIYEETKAVDIIYLDFQKAFDKVPYKRLLKEISRMAQLGKFLNGLSTGFPRENNTLPYTVNHRTGETL